VCSGGYVVLLILLALLSANLPWFSNQYFFFITPKSGKKATFPFVVEWLLMYILVAIIAALIEIKVQGFIQPKTPEFFVITLCLFAVFAFPGLIYKFEINRRKKPVKITN